MNRGVPPTAPNARTGELTPPGTTAPARANSSCEIWSEVTFAVSQTSLTHVREDLQYAYGVGQCGVLGEVHPGHLAAERQHRRRRDDVAVTAVPAHARGLLDALGHRVEVAGPPLVLVLRRPAGRDEEQVALVAHRGARTGGHPVALPALQREPAGLRGHVEDVEDPPGRQNDVRLGRGLPELPEAIGVGRGLHLPNLCGRMRARRRAAD